MSILEDTIRSIKPLNADAMIACKERFCQLAKPIYGMGKFEDLFMQIAGITATADICLTHKKLVVFCADNGVTIEGVAQADSDVTAIMANQYTSETSIASIMAKQAHVEVLPIDVGMKEDTTIPSYKVVHSTASIADGPAMTIEETTALIEIGIQVAGQCKEQGVQLLIAGELGMGNTTPATAITSVLLDKPIDAITGKGAGLSFEAWKHKKEVLTKAIECNQPDKKKPLDVLSKLGSADIAALTGLYIGAAASQIPIVVDGYISAVAALVASKLTYMIGSYILPSHLAKEPGMAAIMERFQMAPIIDAGMNIGEGTGALTLMPALDMALAVYHELPTFESLGMTPYQVFGCH